MNAGGAWQPIETAPRNGKWLLLWCAFEDASEPAIARWVGDKFCPDGPFGRFVWRELDGSGIAERVPTHWKHIGKPRGRK